LNDLRLVPKNPLIYGGILLTCAHIVPLHGTYRSRGCHHVYDARPTFAQGFPNGVPRPEKVRGKCQFVGGFRESYFAYLKICGAGSGTAGVLNLARSRRNGLKKTKYTPGADHLGAPHVNPFSISLTMLSFA
ncbi:MAG: hypothetical protein O7G32_14215, partial [SAR324 cluster bacterium]|nr:hypothetical protein [SAR324 cluster bacterium]